MSEEKKPIWCNRIRYMKERLVNAVTEMEEMNRMADAIHEVDKNRIVLIKGAKLKFNNGGKENGLY